MMMQLLSRWVLILATFAGCTLSAEESTEPSKESAKEIWMMDFDAAKKIAAEKKLPILLNFSGSDWCGWCKLMDRNVFSDQEWVDYIDGKLVTVLVDFPRNKDLVPEQYREQNDKLNAQFQVEGFPTFILLDDDGVTELGRLSAGREKTAKSFIKEIAGLTHERDASVNLVRSKMSEENSAKYLEIIAKIKGIQSAMIEGEEKILKISEELERNQLELIEAKEVARELRVTTLGEEAVAEYETTNEEFKKLSAELEAWIATGPEENQANYQKFSSYRERLASLSAKLGAY